jgi:NYN domain
MDGAGFGGLTRVAVLVDGDNVPARHHGAVMAEAMRLGRVDVRRVYGDTGKFVPWEGFRSVHAGGTKNAADMFLVVDAMALALSDGIGAFVIVSSDRDFAPVALALRERGLVVVGAGPANAGITFQQSCSRFVVLEEGVAPVAAKDGPEEAVRVMPLHRVVVDVIRKAGGEMSMERLALALGKKPDGYARWQSVLLERPNLFTLSGQGKETRVQLTVEAAKVR